MILDKIAEGSEKRPKLVLALVVVLTIVLGMGMLRIEKETDMMAFLPEEKESVETTMEYMNEFGGHTYETILVKGDVLTPEAIQEMTNLENEIRGIPGFALSVESYIDLLRAQNVPDAMIPVAAQAPGAKEALSSMITPDGKAALIQVRVDPDYEGDIEPYLDILNEDRALNISYTGALTQGHDMLGLIDKDNTVLLPLAVLLVIVVLLLTYRRLSDVVLPFVIIAVSVIWVLGIMGYTGLTFSNIFVAIIPLIFGVAVAYSVHMLTRYYEERRKGVAAGKAAVSSIQTVGMAILLTAVTTAFGFGSFGISELPPLRNFGLILVMGILFNFVLVVTLLPSLLVLRDSKKPPEPERVSRVNTYLDRISLAVLRKRKAVLAIAGISALVCLMLLPGISTSISYDDMLPDESPTISTEKEVAELFGGSGQPIIVMMEGNIVEDYQTIVQMENEIRSIDLTTDEGIPMVSQVISFADVLYQTQGDLQSALVNPQSAALLNQTLILDTTSPSFMKKGVVLVLVQAKTDQEAHEITEEIRETCTGYSSLNARVGGSPALLADILQGMQSTQIRTTALALILSLLAVSVLFRSALLGAFTMIPVGLTVAWEFGVLTIAGWNLDLFTIMVSALIIGIGIDFSIHVTHRCREEFERTRNTDKALDETVLHVGKALTSATATTAGAFLVLAFSSMPIITRFGLLVAAVIFLSFLAALFVLPSVLVFYFNRKS
ncbi:MAG: MMPL family transporter [Theionarchaea archaeon]|nr:MMPL family transporter [Theionarchaea archaeon]MBU7000680.1 MMPL family transporter [Theionarchaea archaeon]MBU7022116.1 MMPL family transporter [Theionarchaea archaeon]